MSYDIDLKSPRGGGKMKKSKVLFGAVVASLLLVALSPLALSKSSKSEPKRIVLSADNTITLNDAIDGASVSGVIQRAKELDQEHGINRLLPKSGKEIFLFVRSPGGEIQVGLEMIEALKGINRPVNTVTMFGASMAFQTVQQLGKRYIVKNGVLMSHRAKGGFEGEFGGQRPSQMDSRKGLWESRLDELDGRTVERSNGKQTLESYQKAYNSELWVTGDQAVAQGYADEVVLVRCDESLAGVTTHQISFMGIPIKYDLDNCPLNSTPMNIRVELQTTKGMKNANDFLAEGGEFGTACLVALGTNPNKLCSTDTNMTLERVYQLQTQFRPFYDNIQNRIIPYGK